MAELLDVEAVLSADPPDFKTVDLKGLSFDQVMQLRTAVAALWLSGKSAAESLRQALQVESGPTRAALLVDVQRACHRNRQAMKIIMEVIG